MGVAEAKQRKTNLEKEVCHTVWDVGSFSSTAMRCSRYLLKKEPMSQTA